MEGTVLGVCIYENAHMRIGCVSDTYVYLMSISDMHMGSLVQGGPEPRCSATIPPRSPACAKYFLKVSSKTPTLLQSFPLPHSIQTQSSLERYRDLEVGLNTGDGRTDVGTLWLNNNRSAYVCAYIYIYIHITCLKSWFSPAVYIAFRVIFLIVRI